MKMAKKLSPYEKIFQSELKELKEEIHNRLAEGRFVDDNRNGQIDGDIEKLLLTNYKTIVGFETDKDQVSFPLSSCFYVDLIDCYKGSKREKRYEFNPHWFRDEHLLSQICDFPKGDYDTNILMDLKEDTLTFLHAKGNSFTIPFNSMIIRKYSLSKILKSTYWDSERCKIALGTSEYAVSVPSQHLWLPRNETKPWLYIRKGRGWRS
jgi:hypothetical protein